MYLTFGQAAREAGVAKSTISKAFNHLCCFEATGRGSIRAISLRAPFQPQIHSNKEIVEE
jgi:hypothetical protein